MDLKFYLSLFLRRLHWFLLFVVLGAAAGLTVATILPPVYVARATLVIEPEQIPSELASSTVQTTAAEALQLIEQRIMTRDRLIDMADRLGVYEGADPGRPRLGADEIVADLRQRIVITSAEGGRRNQATATVVTVTFEAPAARLAAAVANDVVTMMLAENVAMRTATAGQTLEFFQGEVDRLDGELNRVNARLLEFQEANIDALPDSLEFRRSQQAAAQDRLAQIDRDEAALRDRRERLVALYESTGQVIAEQAPSQTPEERQLADLRNELASTLLVLSPRNPRVRVLEAQIAQAEARVAAASGIVTGGDTQLSAYEVQLADIDGQLDALAGQREQVVRNLDGLQGSIAATPGNAITLEQLQRDYAALRAQYDEAVSNRARAETGDTIEALAKGQRLTVIEQAVAPGSPTSPDRPLIAAAGLGGGLFVGLGLVVLLEVLNSAVRRPADLVARLGITPFGTLPYIRTRGEVLRRRAIVAAAFLVVLVAVPGALWWVNDRVVPLDVILESVLDRLRPA